MHELIAQLFRLYLPEGWSASDTLAQHLQGHTTNALQLAQDGQMRAIVIPFDKTPDGAEDSHWQQLCALANALQSELGLPAPAVSISGASGYRLWLSLQAPLGVTEAQQFVQDLVAAYVPGLALPPDAASAPVELPPCLHQRTGKWAAFIHPGMGASFADESGLEMAPPLAAQAAFLEGLQSISAAQLAHARSLLAPAPVQSTQAAAPPARPVDAGLLLRDATLEDIVRHLHAMNIEPTFRHLLP
jgi:hypothetical protein